MIFSGASKFYIIFLSILMSSNEKTQNYKVVDLIEVYNLHIKIIFIRHRIKGVSIFWNLSLITRQNMVLKFYIIFSSILMSSNEKTQNYKVLDLIEVYNLHIKIIFIRHRIEGFSIFWNLSLIAWNNFVAWNKMSCTVMT